MVVHMAPTFPILAIPGYEADMQDLMAAAHEVLNRDSDEDDFITDMLPAVPKHVVPYIPVFSSQNGASRKLEEYSITLPEVPDDSPLNEKAAGAEALEDTLKGRAKCDSPDELAAHQEKKAQLTDAIIELRLERLKITHNWDTILPWVDIDSEEARVAIEDAMSMRCGTLKKSTMAYCKKQLNKQVDIVNVQAAKEQQPDNPTPGLLNNVSICVDVMKALDRTKLQLLFLIKTKIQLREIPGWQKPSKPMKLIKS